MRLVSSITTALRKRLRITTQVERTSSGAFCDSLFVNINESIVEEAALTWFGELSYTIGHGPDMAPGELTAERDSFGDVVVVGRLRDAITRLNPTIPEDAREEALHKVLHLDNPAFLANNRAFHHMLRDGVEVEYKRPDGAIAGDHVQVVDFTDAQANDWLAVNQFTVIEGQHNRRPDIVVFDHGLPRRDRRRSIISVFVHNYRNYGTMPA